MTILERFYASGGPEVEIETLTITVGSQVHYLVKAFENVTARLETGETVTFIACGMDVAKPSRNADGVQDLRFALSNVDGVVSSRCRSALAAKQRMVVTLRVYLHNDLLAPIKAPLELVVKSGQWTGTEAQLTAGLMNILDTEWPRDRYNLAQHPGLRYIT